MPNFRPAGMSDDDTDSDDGFYERPVRSAQPQSLLQQHSTRKKIENNLQDAIINGNIGEVERIVVQDLKNEVNLKLDSGWTALMHACFHAQENIVEFLLNKGANPNLHADSVTPAMTTCSNSSADNDSVHHIIKRLIARGCILNIGDKYGQTPLMRAISSGRVSVVQTLLEHDVNIEMRDQQGWTAVFWAAHHNQPEILEMLIARGARLAEVDKSGRTPTEIANTHEYNSIVEILDRCLKPADGEGDYTPFVPNELVTWHDFYPGLEGTPGKINYSNEISHLLYGMHCERLAPIIQQREMDLRKFLLLEERDLPGLGIDMPFEKQRLLSGLQKFHTRSWKLSSVAGLYAMKSDNYGVLDCVTSLGSHLQQVYILEASLQYTLREYKRVQCQLKFEPPDSKLLAKLGDVARSLLRNIHSIRKEMNHMKKQLVKISKNNPTPADFIKEKSVRDIMLSYVSEIVVVCTIGCLLYHAKQYLPCFIKK